MRTIVFWLLWVFVFTIPWENMIAFQGFALLPGGGGTLSKAIGMAAASLAILAVVLSGQVRRVLGIHYAMALFVAWACLSLAWSAEPTLSYVRITTFLQLAGLAWLIWEFASTTRQQTWLMHAYIWGGGIAIGTQFVGFLHAGVASRLRVARFAGGGLNLNNFAVTVATTIPMAAFYVTNKDKSNMLRVAYAVYCVLASFSILLTGSRTGLVVLLVAVGFTVLAHVRVRPLFIVVLLAVAAVFVIVAPAYLPEQTIERFVGTPDEIRTGTLTHRTAIWAGGWELFLRHPLVGTGSGTFTYVISEELTGIWSSIDAHNIYLRVLVELGIVGLTLLLTVCLLAVIYAWRMPRRERFLWLVTLAVWLIGGLAMNTEDRKPMWFLLGLLAAQYAALYAQPLVRRVLVRKSPPATGRLANKGNA